MRAIDRFDHTRGNRFGTYAFWWIKQGIERFVTENNRLIRLPSNVAQLLRRIKRLQQEQAELLGCDPEPEDIAAGDPEGASWLENLEDGYSPSPGNLVETQDSGTPRKVLNPTVARRRIPSRIQHPRF